MNKHYFAALRKLATAPGLPEEEITPAAPTSAAPITRPGLHALGAMGGGLLAFGSGMAAGYGITHGLEKLLGNRTSPLSLQTVGPALGGLSMLAYQQYKAHEHKELHRALEAYQNERARRLSTRGRP